MGASRCPGSQGRFHLLEIDDGTLCLQPSSAPGPTKYSLWPQLHEPGFLQAALGMSDAVTAEDKAEFAIIKKMPVLNSKRRVYQTVEQYVSDRTLYFGAPATYADFAAESDEELSTTEWKSKRRTRTLRSMIEFGHKGEVEKQKIFYRWVRMAYKKKYGDDVNVPELIRRGMSQELADKVKEVRGSVRVKGIKDENFHAGGFNPRPVKYSHHYLLGTLSEHATGMAVDIEDSGNAQLTLQEFKFVEDLTGKTVKRSGRWANETEAEALWKDIHELNRLFVAKVTEEVKRIEKERAASVEKALKEKKHAPKFAQTPLQEVLGANFKALSPWATKGFFNLPLELVLEFHAHGFTWGATFGSNVDLHHFELD